MKTTSLKLPDRLRQRLDTLARRSGRSRSEIVRIALERFLERQEKRGSFSELASDLAGSVSGPADLSSNHEYLSDYGE